MSSPPSELPGRTGRSRRPRPLANLAGLLFIALLVIGPVVHLGVQVHDRRPPDGVATSTARVIDHQNPGRRTDRHIVTFRTTSGQEGTLSTDRTRMPDAFTVWRDPGTGQWVSPQARSWLQTVLALVFGTGLGLLLLVAWVRIRRNERADRAPEVVPVANQA